MSDICDRVIEVGQIGGRVDRDVYEAVQEIKRLRAALKPFAEPHAMGDSYVQFAPRLIEASREALKQ